MKQLQTRQIIETDQGDEYTVAAIDRVTTDANGDGIDVYVVTIRYMDGKRQRICEPDDMTIKEG